MKKSVQVSINEIAIARWNEAIAEYNDAYTKATISKLYSCSARVFETDNYYFLCSYNTIVACYNKNSIEFTDMLRYVYGFTATSSQHIAKFRNWVRDKEHLCYCDMHDLRYYPV